MSKFLSSDLKRLKPYVPGEQPQDRSYIKLNTNESPFPPSAGAIAAAQAAASSLNLYSDPDCTPLKRAAAALYGLEECNVSACNGSDENLAHIFRAFFAEKGVAFPDITYGFYPVLCSLLGIEYKTIPLRADFTIDISDYEGLDCPVCIANPNAQTGIYLARDAVERLVRQNPHRLVVVDEAYIDFGGTSCAPLVERYGNLIVVQTMSKSRSLAGARVGFTFACGELIAELEGVRCSFNPYNINRMSMSAAAESLKDKKYFEECTQKIVSVRQYTAANLQKLGFFVLPSTANFLLARSPQIGGEELYLKLKERGILVRHFTDERIAGFVRISIGKKEHMDRFLAEVKAILAEV